MVVFEDGIPRREHYRKFAISNARDDTEAIWQVVSRRLQRLTAPPEEGESERKGFSYPPGLLVIDGGLPQVNAAKRALEEAGIDIPVCGLAKKLEEVWMPGAAYPIILPRSSDGMFLLQRVRDEAHRVALRYQRSTRARVLGSELSDIDGVGPTTVKSLLRHFGSVTRVKKASRDQLLEVEGVGPRVADTIVAHFGNPEAASASMKTSQPPRT
jgi:excinuclease ABC subunit C